MSIYATPDGFLESMDQQGQSHYRPSKNRRHYRMARRKRHSQRCTHSTRHMQIPQDVHPLLLNDCSTTSQANLKGHAL